MSTWLNTEALAAQLTTHFGAEAVSTFDQDALQPWIEIAPSFLVPVCRFLREDPAFYFDMLACLTGLDEGTKANRIGVIYHLTSIPKNQQLVLKCMVARDSGQEENKGLPVLPSVSAIWRTAEWHEREAYDLFGLFFTNHPDLRRILMPEDWPGHPLRKDYENPEFYHDVQTAY